MDTEELRRAFKRAEHQGHDQFRIKENGKEFVFLAAYAKYMLEYLDSIGVKTFKLTEAPSVTGRVSVGINQQTVPVRTDDGRAIRNAFLVLPKRDEKDA